MFVMPNSARYDGLSVCVGGDLQLYLPSEALGHHCISQLLSRKSVQKNY